MSPNPDDANRAEDVLIVLVSAPPAQADALARSLVEARVAACVSVIEPVRSVYRWQGQVEEAREALLVVKTAASRYADLEAAVRAAHSYETPEIIAVPLRQGLPAYLRWVVAESEAST